jgi:hypothetical protein
MDLNKICVGLMVLVTVLGITCVTDQNAAYGIDVWSGGSSNIWSGETSSESWIKENASSVGMRHLTATIHVHIKNNNDQVQYFKISQKYTGTLTNSINWTVSGSCPSAKKMVDSVSPELGGDWGWKINPGETKEVTFKVSAYGLFGAYPGYISNEAAEENTYWALIPDPGLFSSWFWPNEIEMLNPNLDLQYWKGTFSFYLTNYDSHTVSGIVRGPIIPVNSKLVSASPSSNSFIDKDIYLNSNTVAWDTTIGPGKTQYYKYVYVWPSSSSSSSSDTGTYSSTIPKTTAAKKTTSLPTEETGLPYSLFIVGGIIAAGGVVYARFMR